MTRLKINVSGRVQGIGFRFSAMQAAYKYGVRGFVKNCPDGSVYLEAEGENQAVDQFLDWCKRGPIGARVEKTQSEYAEPEGYKRFDIK
ncbi:MAG TPA: acylphosphatase [Bacteroidales bacterium]|nr:acylphosphatase [Bacteroidales bacterium]